MVSEQIKNYEEAIRKLAILFAKGEISEITYKTSVQAIEEKMSDLKQNEKEHEISEVRKVPQTMKKFPMKGKGNLSHLNCGILSPFSLA